MDPRFRSFLRERRCILKDLEDFLGMVLLYFINIEEELLSREEILNLNGKLESLIKSLWFIHSLYGYPPHPDDDEEGKNYHI